MTANHPAEGAGMLARRWFLAGVAESQRLATVTLAAAAGAVMLTVVAGPGGAFRRKAAADPFGGLRPGRCAAALAAAGARGGDRCGGAGRCHWPRLVAVWRPARLALYFPALRLPRPKSIALAVAVAAVLGAALAYAALAVRTGQSRTQATENFVPLAGAWFIADSVAARRRYQAGLTAQAERERAAEIREERVRIAREMHDVVAHALAVITVQAGVGRCLAGRPPDETSSVLGSIETMSRMAQDELRIVLGLLRDGQAGTAPLAPVSRLTDVKDLADTVRVSGIPVELRMEGIDRQLSPSLELSIYRVMQEALTNVVKHAPGAQAVAELTVSARKVRLVVRDDGGPGGAPRAVRGAGHGITGVRERIGAFGGWLVAGPVAGRGFQVTAEVPVEVPVEGVAS